MHDVPVPYQTTVGDEVLDDARLFRRVGTSWAPAGTLACAGGPARSGIGNAFALSGDGTPVVAGAYCRAEREEPRAARAFVLAPPDGGAPLRRTDRSQRCQGR